MVVVVDGGDSGDGGDNGMALMVVMEVAMEVVMGWWW